MENIELAKIRHPLKLTQDQMADLMGCSPVGYKRFEQGGRPILRYISNSAKALSLIEKNGLRCAVRYGDKPAKTSGLISTPSSRNFRSTMVIRDILDRFVVHEVKKIIREVQTLREREEVARIEAESKCIAEAEQERRSKKAA
jgi:transcriptional regulator with XRE-family HTH domain